MFLVNLVPLVLLVGVLFGSGVDTAEQTNELRDAIVTVFDKMVEYSLKDDTQSLIKLFHQNATIMMGGLPPVIGHEEIRTLLEILPEKASDIKCILKVVEPMDECADFVYVAIHFEFYNELREKYMDGNGVDVFRKTGDGYKFYITMFNKLNQQTSDSSDSG
ncbi:uncharacterized protein [Asterias amurensis]|uniref:uncharacterized protein n=1 Tax=Asterias amurensis TaxID=7602 RepID=UPI003AB8EB2F